MESIDLTPQYSCSEAPGRCIKCLAEEKLLECLRELFKDESDNLSLQQKYELLYSFLGSPDLQKLCDETERYLAEGNDVSVRISLKNGKLEYKIKT
jgi:hypothetical protein